MPSPVAAGEASLIPVVSGPCSKMDWSRAYLSVHDNNSILLLRYLLNGLLLLFFLILFFKLLLLF